MIDQKVIEENSYKKVIEKIESQKIQVGYYDYSKVSAVKSGKICVPQGWYIQNGKTYNMSNPPNRVYETFLECVLNNMKQDNDE